MVVALPARVRLAAQPISGMLVNIYPRSRGISLLPDPDVLDGLIAEPVEVAGGSSPNASRPLHRARKVRRCRNGGCTTSVAQWQPGWPKPASNRM
jgi:hypothetical protein